MPTFIPSQNPIETIERNGINVATAKDTNTVKNQQEAIDRYTDEVLKDQGVHEIGTRSQRSSTFDSISSKGTDIMDAPMKQPWWLCCGESSTARAPKKKRANSFARPRFTSLVRSLTGEIQAQVINAALFDENSTEKTKGYCQYLGINFTSTAKAAYGGGGNFFQRLTNKAVNTMSAEDKNKLKEDFNGFLQTLANPETHTPQIQSELAQLIATHGSYLSAKEGSRYSPVNFVLMQWFFDPTLKQQLIALLNKFTLDGYCFDVVTGPTEKPKTSFLKTDTTEPSSTIIKLYIAKDPKVSRDQVFNQGIKIKTERSKEEDNGMSLAEGLWASDELTPDLINSGYYAVAIDTAIQPYLITRKYVAEGNEKKYDKECSILYMGSTDNNQAYLHADCIIAAVDPAARKASCHRNGNFGQLPAILEQRESERANAVAAAEAVINPMMTSNNVTCS